MSEKQISRRGLIVGGIVGSISVYIGGQVVVAVSKSMDEFHQQCDERYGENNWTLVPANESERAGGLFAGEEYVCVDNESPRADT